MPTLTRKHPSYSPGGPRCGGWFTVRPKSPLRSFILHPSYFILLFLILLISGCATRGPRRAVETPAPIVVAGIQYSVSTGNNPGYNTVEIYIENNGAHPVTFITGELEGFELPRLDAAAARKMAHLIKFPLSGDEHAPVDFGALPPDSPITWWQIYPDPIVAPGAAVVCRINLRGSSASHRKLVLRDAAGEAYPIRLPRFTQPQQRILAVTWSLDYRRMFVQYDSGRSSLKDIAMNRQTVGGYTVLQGARSGMAEVAALTPPVGLKRGDPVDLHLRFADGSERRAHIRAAAGIMLDAPWGWRRSQTLPPEQLAAYHLDADPAIGYLPYDVACGDTRAKSHGAAAMTVADARQDAWLRQPDRLSGVEFCTAIYGSIWNIYAPMTDAVFIKPYQLHWGPDASRFIEHEEDRIATAQTAAAPRPAVWVPERYKRNRHIEGEELRVMAWMALARGVKGIRYHFWMNDRDAPFRESPGLGTAMQAVNAEIKQLESILGPLLLADTRLDRHQMIKVYESWSGDNGILLLVRNMNYRTDAQADNAGHEPRFRVTPSENVAVSLDLPPWMTPGNIVDPLGGETLSHEQNDRTLSINLPGLDAYSLIWVENDNRPSPLKITRRAAL